MFRRPFRCGSKARVVEDLAAVSDVVADTLNQAHGFKRLDASAAAADGHGWICVWADNENGLMPGSFLSGSKSPSFFSRTAPSRAASQGYLVAFAVITRNR